jgi:hypothetical protein
LTLEARHRAIAAEASRARAAGRDAATLAARASHLEEDLAACRSVADALAEARTDVQERIRAFHESEKVRLAELEEIHRHVLGEIEKIARAAAAEGTVEELRF